jgi:hypothetical protein
VPLFLFQLATGMIPPPPASVPPGGGGTADPIANWNQVGS